PPANHGRNLTLAREGRSFRAPQRPHGTSPAPSPANAARRGVPVPAGDAQCARSGQGQDKGQEMKPPSNRELFEYWNLRRGERLAPERGDIEPGAIRSILGDTFVLEM